MHKAKLFSFVRNTFHLQTYALKIITTKKSTCRPLVCEPSLESTLYATVQFLKYVYSTCTETTELNSAGVLSWASVKSN